MFKILKSTSTKKENVIHIRNLKLALNNELALKKCIETLSSIKKLGLDHALI